MALSLNQLAQDLSRIGYRADILRDNSTECLFIRAAYKVCGVTIGWQAVGGLSLFDTGFHLKIEFHQGLVAGQSLAKHLLRHYAVPVTIHSVYLDPQIQRFQP